MENERKNDGESDWWIFQKVENIALPPMSFALPNLMEIHFGLELFSILETELSKRETF